MFKNEEEKEEKEQFLKLHSKTCIVILTMKIIVKMIYLILL